MGKPQSAPSAENNFTSPKPKPSFFSTARQIRSIKKKSRNPHTAPSSGLYQVRINHCPVNKSQYAPARQSKARSAVNWSGIIVYFPSHHAIAANTKKNQDEQYGVGRRPIHEGSPRGAYGKGRGKRYRAFNSEAFPGQKFLCRFFAVVAEPFCRDGVYDKAAQKGKPRAQASRREAGYSAHYCAAASCAGAPSLK